MSNKAVVLMLLGISLCCGGLAQAGTWSTLDYPGAIETHVYGIDGSNVVGYYRLPTGSFHGFLHDGTNWTTLDRPGATSTRLTDIDGSNIVGEKCLYNMLTRTWTILDVPGYIYGISGSNIVGTYSDSIMYNHGFIYTSGQAFTLDKPGATWTHLFDIDGDNVAGLADATGFVYNLTSQSWSSYSVPAANLTFLRAIDGKNLAGFYYSSLQYHGFYYDGANWLTIDCPGAEATYIYHIDGNKLAGTYTDESGNHGFVYTIPEPSSLLLLLFGILGPNLIQQKHRGFGLRSPGFF